jgi:hypothetical protein
MSTLSVLFPSITLVEIPHMIFGGPLDTFFYQSITKHNVKPHSITETGKRYAIDAFRKMVYSAKMRTDNRGSFHNTWRSGRSIHFDIVDDVMKLW